MYRKKTPVSQLPDKNEFTVYNPNNKTCEACMEEWPEFVNIISVDPGIRNLVVRVENRAIHKDGPIKTIVFEKLHISEESRKLDGNVDNLFLYITDFLDKYLHVFKNCQFLIIERQVPMNYRAVRISQHIISYFLMHFKNNGIGSLIYEVDPKLKGKQLGAPKNLNERGLKQWAVEECKRLFDKRKDVLGLKILNDNKKKADDHSDTVIQIEAFFKFNGWRLTPTPINIILQHNI